MHFNAAPRRRHDAALKAQVLSECDERGASVAAVALSHGLNANLVHKWRRLKRARPVRTKAVVESAAAGAFLALALPTPTPTAALSIPDIRIELRRGAMTMTIAWPGASAAQCAAWLREWLL